MTSRLPLPAVGESVTVQAVATVSVEQVLRRLDSSVDGVSNAQVCERLAHYGPNAIRTHRVSAWAVLARQLNNAVLILLVYLSGSPDWLVGTEVPTVEDLRSFCSCGHRRAQGGLRNRRTQSISWQRA